MREPSLTITTIAGTRQPTDGPELVSASDASDESACFMLRRELHELPVVARFTVEGEPVSKARARFTKQGYKTQAYTPQKTLQAEQVIGWKFRAAARGHRLDPDAAYGVMGLFFCGTRQRRDVDNMLKLILDSLNGIAWPDDSQVTEVSAKKTLTLPENARTEVLVYRVGDVQRNIATCDKCGRDFATYPSWNNPKQRKRFCSQTCHLAWRDERKRTECAQCGKVFLRAKPNIPQKYCSRDCTDLAKRVELTCPHCEVRFTVTRHAGHRPRYCSPSCRDTAARERNKKNADQGFRQSESGSGMSGIAKAVLASDSRKHVLRVTYQLESGSCPRGRLRLIVTEVPGHHQRRSP
jgi:Holliday junction resolvase RusA-like endonuclease